MSAMTIGQAADGLTEQPGRRLTGLYTRTLVWYLLGMALLWMVGIEGVYGSPMPFYALPFPAFSTILIPGVVLLVAGLAYTLGSSFAVTRSRPRTLALFGVWVLAALSLGGAFLLEAGRSSERVGSQLAGHWELLRWHLLAMGVFAVFLVALVTGLRRVRWFEAEPSRRAVAWLLTGLVAFAFLFAGAVAMLRGGPDGIAHAYGRQTYEYVGDIGVTSSIKTLFRDYLKVRPYLSMHAKVHPPGPIAILWALSYVIGQGALALSVATMAVGALGVLPLYFWACEWTNRRVAITCCALYSLMPSIVLFTATSADILFMPFVLGTLFLFSRAILRNSLPCALLAGVGYAILSLLSFSLVGLGAFFALVGLLRAWQGHWRGVAMTAAVMLAAFVGVHVAVWWWTGFDVVACFWECKAQFYLDQANMDQLTPRYPSWVWRIANPACLFYFAGIPVSLMFLWRLLRPEPDTKTAFAVFAATLFVLNFLYLAHGEGERSAMYVLPFLVLPAAHWLDQAGRAGRSLTPLTASVCFLAFQCWLTESYFYTFW
ncbi:MAG: hypothetical protein GWP08_18425 [Nitrospiraceae bacterium]|nr:hypothetical protein [Nitrospiraceae bacterium]